MIEVEIKLEIRNPQEVRQILVQRGFVEKAHIQETDMYFDNGEGYIRTSGYALRVRRTRDLEAGTEYAQLNFKGKKLDRVSMSRAEYETEVADGDTMQGILEMLQYKPVDPIVVKEREMLQCGDMAACLDQVKDLGHFLELEILVEDETQKEHALARIETLLHTLGYKIEDTATKSYLSMLRQVRCPVCGLHYFAEQDNKEVCHKCGWKNDQHQNENHDSPAGANGISLNEYKMKFVEWMHI